MTTKPKLLAAYPNGNYVVRLYDDGTKIKTTDGETFCADFPDSIDLKITDRCNLNCPMCHENSSENGPHADLSSPILNTLRRGTELAIGGGNPLCHAGLQSFLSRMKQRGVICNLTVNEKHFLQNADLLKNLLDDCLIRGLGISLSVYDDKTLRFASSCKTTVLHAICGILDEQRANLLYDKNLKILLLGFKDVGRGKAFHSKQTDDNIAWLSRNVLNFADKFNTVCFDNLAIEQLCLQDKLPKALFESGFMGEDGESSMYIDLVKAECAVSSASNVRYPLPKTIDRAFALIRNKRIANE